MVVRLKSESYDLVSFRLRTSLPPTGLALNTSCIPISASVMDKSTWASKRRKNAAVSLLSSILARLQFMFIITCSPSRMLCPTVVLGEKTHFMPIQLLEPTENGMKASFILSSFFLSSQLSGTNASASAKAFSFRWIV